jgi:hypothetical protein
MPAPVCPNCIMGRILKNYHEKSAIIAKKVGKMKSNLNFILKIMRM